MSAWNKFLETIKQNKILLGSLAGALAGFLIYKAFTEEEQPVQLMDEKEKYLYELQELKDKVNLQTLGKDDLKEIFDFLLRTTHKRLADHSVAFKKQRRTLKDVDFEAYLNCLVGGFTKMQQLTVEVNMQVMKELGISEQRLQMAMMQHPDLMRYMPKFEPVHKFRELTLEEVREALKFQKNYIANHGQQLVDNIKHFSESWDPSSKSMLPVLFGLIASDEIASALGFEEEQVEQARVKYQRDLTAQISAVQEAVGPFVGQLSSSPLFGMGGPGGPMGAGMEGFDPEAFENFMNTMGMDPSMLEGMDPSLLGFDPSAMNFDPAMLEQFAGQMGGMGGHPELMNQRFGV